jgi:NAD(P)-dependent dehydrogenase (short-subunit alcohol dehydrogenase family)
MRLENKTAMIYGAGGAIGGAVARAFARDGATVFLTGRHQAKVELVARDIRAAGGQAEAAQVDALDEPAIDRIPTLTELANVAAFMASDDASALTGTIANLSMGLLDD